MSADPYVALLRGHSIGILATLMPDGRPQLSTITYSVNDAGTTVRVSITDGRVKTRNVRRDPRAALHVNGDSPWSWVVAEGKAELSAVAADSDDETVDELVDIYRSISGEHPDWDEFRRAMVAEHRVALRLHIDHCYGQV